MDPQQPNLEIRRQLDWPDKKLLQACRVEFIRVSGPGGQHRNKVSSGVRLLHLAGDFIVTATERRSQHENLAMAVNRLREAIAIRFRAPLSVPVQWPEGVAVRDQRLKVSLRNPQWPQTIGLALDALEDSGGNLAQAAVRLEVTTSSLARFLAEHGAAWAEANQICARHGRGGLRRPGG